MPPVHLVDVDFLKRKQEIDSFGVVFCRRKVQSSAIIVVCSIDFYALR